MSRPNDVPSADSARVTPAEVNLMVACAVRSTAVAEACRQRLSPDLFMPGREATAALLWSTFLSTTEAKGIPADPNHAFALMTAQVQREYASRPDLYSDNAVQELCDPQYGLLRHVFFSPAPPKETEDAVVDILVRFLTERLMADPLRMAIEGVSIDRTITDPTKLVAQIEAAADAVNAVRVDPGSDGVAGIDFTPPSTGIFTTGMPWLDEIMGGGQAPGECYLVMGPTGGGKTPFVTQIAVQGARYQAALSQKSGGKKRWMYFTYELTRNQMLERFYSFGAMISRDTFNVPDGSQVAYTSSAANGTSLHPYELEKIVNPSDVKLGEKERAQAYVKELSGSGPGDSWLRLVDYSGNVPGYGTGGVPEMVSYCRRMKSQGADVAGVVIDYAGLVVSRYRQKNVRMKPSDDYELLATFMDEVRTTISIPFACPVWVLHQFHGDVTGMSPGARLSLNQGRGGRNMGDNADFAFGLGNCDKEKQLLAFWMFKHRRVKWDGRPVVAKFDGRFGYFARPDGSWKVDPYTKEFVESGFGGGGLSGVVPGA